MKVKDLIKLLKKEDGEKEIRIIANYLNWESANSPVKKVEYNEENKTVYILGWE